MKTIKIPTSEIEIEVLDIDPESKFIVFSESYLSREQKDAEPVKIAIKINEEQCLKFKTLNAEIEKAQAEREKKSQQKKKEKLSVFIEEKLITDPTKCIHIDILWREYSEYMEEQDLYGLDTLSRTAFQNEFKTKRIKMPASFPEEFKKGVSTDNPRVATGYRLSEDSLYVGSEIEHKEKS